jgi:hypothetical protein
MILICKGVFWAAPRFAAHDLVGKQFKLHELCYA